MVNFPAKQKNKEKEEKKLSKEKKEQKEKHKILITSALPYVNNVPHLGTLICVLSANVYDRFLKLKGKEVLSVLGTDENGTTTETKAYELGITPRDCVDKFFKIHREIYEWFGCRFDCFGRTSSKANHEISSGIFLKLYKNGFIAENEIEQLYSEKEQRFLADRFVEGVCPYCSYEKARGDQCDNCGKLLNATELINPVSKISGDKPIIKKTKHLFIDLPKLQPRLEKWIDSVKSQWTENARTTTESWLKEGLKKRAITRDIKWGIPVPLEGFESKVFYSWFDAPIGYISITKECRKDWEEWWKNKDTKTKTQLVQFMGKDNIPFHTILFPAFLIGAEDNYILADRLSVNEYLNYETGKFSKSLNQGVFCDDAIKTGIPADAWRYYLIINHPDNHDSQFTWDNFQERINNELVANIGNLVNRTLQFINKYYKSSIPSIVYHFEYEEETKKIEQLYEQIRLKDALKEILHLSKKANTYFQDNEPWKNIKENKEKADNAIANLASLIKDISIIIEPILPFTAQKIRDMLNIEKKLSWNDLHKKTLLQGHKIKKAEILFNKLEDEDIAKFKKKFAGKKYTEAEKKAIGKNKAESGIVENADNNDNSEVVDISILNLKVAEVKEVKDHPDAEKLVVIKIDMGSEQRQLVAGLKDYYKKEELLGKKLVVLANLEPARLRGEKSEGMLLAAEDKTGKVGVLFVEESQPGEQVFVEGKPPKTKQITFKDFLKVKIEAKNGKIYSSGKVLKTVEEDVKLDKVKDGEVR